MHVYGIVGIDKLKVITYYLILNTITFVLHLRSYIGQVT